MRKPKKYKNKQTKNPQQDILFTLGHTFKHLSFKKKTQTVFGKRLLCGFLITTTQVLLQMVTLQGTHLHCTFNTKVSVTSI